MKNIKYLLGVVLVAGLTTACQKFDPVEKGYVEEGSAEDWTVAEAGKVKTIHQFLDACLKEKADAAYPPRSNSGDKNLYSVNDIDQDIIIVGRVVSTDVPGNIYKSIYIQDCADPKQGLKIGIDAGSIGGFLAQGQKIAIKVKGLSVGKYANMPQLGVPTYNTAKEGLDKDTKKGWEVGRIPTPIFKAHLQRIGVAEPNKIVANEMSIADIKAAGCSDYMTIAKMSAVYVKISGVHFTGDKVDYGKITPLTAATDLIFAPSTDGIGYPQSRVFANESGDTLSIGTSEYAKFAAAPLPGAEYTGVIYGFTSYYNDKATNTPSVMDWSITLNGLDGIGAMKGKDGIQLSNGSSVWRADDVFYPQY